MYFKAHVSLSFHDFFHIPSLNGGYRRGYTQAKQTKHGSKNYPRRLKYYFSHEMSNYVIENYCF